MDPPPAWPSPKRLAFPAIFVVVHFTVSGLGKDRRPGVASGRSRGGGHDGVHVYLADTIRRTLSARQQGARLSRAMSGRSPRHRTVIQWVKGSGPSRDLGEGTGFGS